jgi:hypothetical protein
VPEPHTTVHSYRRDHDPENYAPQHGKGEREMTGAVHQVQAGERRLGDQPEVFTYLLRAPNGSIIRRATAAREGGWVVRFVDRIPSKRRAIELAEKEISRIEEAEEAKEEDEEKYPAGFERARDAVWDWYYTEDD